MRHLANRPSPPGLLPLSLLLVAALTGCRTPLPGGGGDGGTPDGGLDGGGNGSDGGPGLVPGWNPPTQVGATRDSYYIEIYTVDVDLASTGTHGLVVWDEVGESSGSVWASRFDGTSWLPSVRLSPAGMEAGFPRMALNDQGQAVVAYEVEEYSDSDQPLGQAVWFQRLQGDVWTAPERLSPTPSTDPSVIFSASEPRVGIDAQGNALVAWSQYSSNNSALRGAFLRRHDGTGWSEPLRLNEGTLTANLGGLAVGAGGRAVTVWVQDTNPYDPGKSGGGPRVPNMWARTYDGSVWSAPVRIGPELVDFEGVQRPAATIDASGRAFVVWEEGRLEQARIGAARFDPLAGAWDPPVAVASSAAAADHLSFVSVATDGQGNAFATWSAHVSGGDDESGVAALFDGNLGTWSTPSTFVTNWDLTETRAAMGAAGQAWALFSRPNDAGTSELLARALQPDGSWAEPAVFANGWLADAEGNTDGVLLVGAQQRWYSSTQPLLRTAPGASFFLPAP